MSDSLRRFDDSILKGSVTLSGADFKTVWAFIESEINQARREALEQALDLCEKRTHRGGVARGGMGQVFANTQDQEAREIMDLLRAQLSSVQQEAPTNPLPWDSEDQQLLDSSMRNMYGTKANVEQEVRRMLTHRYSAAGCIACDLTESEHVDGTQIPDPRATAPTEQEAPKPLGRQCEFVLEISGNSHFCVEYLGHAGVHVIHVNPADCPAAAPTDISGERQREALSDAHKAMCDAHSIVKFHLEREMNSPSNHQEFAQEARDKLRAYEAAIFSMQRILGTPQQTTATQREEK